MSGERQADVGRGGRERLAAHGEQCEACQAQPLPLDRIATALNAEAVAVDAAAMSQRTLLRLRPVLARRTSAVFFRRVALKVLLALLPLPAVLAYDVYWLRVAYGIAGTVLPLSVAVYVVSSYAAFLVLLFAVTYAAIPLLVQPGTGRPIGLGVERP